MMNERNDAAHARYMARVTIIEAVESLARHAERMHESAKQANNGTSEAVWEFISAEWREAVAVLRVAWNIKGAP